MRKDQIKNSLNSADHCRATKHFLDENDELKAYAFTKKSTPDSHNCHTLLLWKPFTIDHKAALFDQTTSPHEKQ